MLWVSFSGDIGRGGLYFLPKKMNADVYVKVLEEHMLNVFRIHGSEVFVHDCAPCHKAKKVTNFFSSHRSMF